MHPAIALALAYLSGSIPFAAIAGRAKGIDLRKQGSGNLGATNVFRIMGWKIGVAVFLADALKGALPVFLLPPRIDSARDPVIWGVFVGIAAIAGHVRPAFLGFRKGGKGVATAAGVFDSGVIGPGHSGSRVAARAGRHAYVCTLHPGMKGEVVVQ